MFQRSRAVWGAAFTLAGASLVQAAPPYRFKTLTLSQNLGQPSGIAIDSADNVYVSDEGTQTVIKISNGRVSTIAGTSGVKGLALSQLNLSIYPLSGLAVDGSGNVFVADNTCVREVSGSGVTTFAEIYEVK